jgi:hypothetical protein
MKGLDFSRYAFSVAVTLLAACGGSQPLIVPAHAIEESSR